LTRSDLQQLARLRLREAKALNRAGLHAGAYYLAGYAVECALKACIAKRVRRHDFPDKATVQASWTHSLQDLVKAAELKAPLDSEVAANSQFAANWATVSQWRESVRYDTGVAPNFASDIISAISSRATGVLPWIVKRW
jgi:HEPN domain-containing protein